MNKRAGHPCPECNAIPCSEYALKGEGMRWKCNDCGASGWLAVTPKPAEPPRVHKNPGRLS